MKRFYIACLTALLCLSLIGTALAKDPIRVGVVIPSTIDDMAWSQSMYEGLQAVQASKGKGAIEFSVSERLGNPVDAAAAIRQYAAQGYDIVIAHGTQYQSLLNDIAPDFPKTSFAYGTGFSAAHPNIFAYDPHAQEGSYLLGMLAGFITKSNIIGIVGPVEAGDAVKFNRGFTMGVKASNPKAEVRIAYTGSFNDLVGAGEVAKAHIQAGADVLSGSAQQAVGAIKAASEVKGIVWMGSDLNPVKIAPETVLASQIYDFSKVLNVILDDREKGILGGKAIPLTLANGFEYIIYNKPINPEYLKKIDAAKAAIIDGSLKIDITKK